MCGRYTLKATPAQIQEALSLSAPPNWLPRYNLAPTQPGLIVTSHGLKRVRWGAPRPNVFNLRAETHTVSTGASPCLVVCDGFFEWRNDSAQRTPFYFSLADSAVFTLAGLCFESGFSILTRPAVGVIRDIHLRMPVIVDHAYRQSWLHSTCAALALEPPAFNAVRVGTRVNRATVDDEGCIAPAREVQLTLW